MVTVASRVRGVEGSQAGVLCMVRGGRVESLTCAEVRRCKQAGSAIVTCHAPVVDMLTVWGPYALTLRLHREYLSTVTPRPCTVLRCMQEHGQQTSMSLHQYSIHLSYTPEIYPKGTCILPAICFWDMHSFTPHPGYSRSRCKGSCASPQRQKASPAYPGAGRVTLLVWMHVEQGSWGRLDVNVWWGSCSPRPEDPVETSPARATCVLTGQAREKNVPVFRINDLTRRRKEQRSTGRRDLVPAVELS